MYETDLAGVRAAMKAAVDADAEACRLQYLTRGAGQAMVYEQKAREAEALVAAGGIPDPADYPILAASVGIEADTLQEVAQLVIATRTAWTGIAAQIESIRLSAKKAIDASEDPIEIRRIRNEATWP